MENFYSHNSMEEAAVNILVPVMEFAVYSAAKYANACQRNTVTAKDMEYGMKYAARNYVGKQIGSHFDDEEDSESEEDDFESDEDDFTRYDGDDQIIQAMNECFDTWESWMPENPAEIMLKNAIDEQNKSVLN